MRTDLEQNGHSLKVNDQVIISITENATTGYQWEIDEDALNDVAEKIDDEYVCPEPTDPPMVGVPCERVYTLTGIREG